ncbi:uncharacterized protein EV422DRAFT_487684, partial [Fimicolochytrium jonesii]|uniref:uncharacterized protein n=1 Tax=Fimicolochytrium jonesii TaxID=1396493 RepID=UPI0022FF44BA
LWMLECSRTLYLLHARVPPIIHHDIKAQNIMIHPERKHTLLVDFGIARVC